MRPLLRLVAIVIVSTLLASSCGDDDQNQVSAPSSDSDGGVLYAANCASCHGTDLRGTERGPSHLSIVYEPDHHPDEAFRSAIRNGAAQHHWDFGAMPPIEGLSDAEVEAIIEFVRAEQESEGFER